MRRADQRSLIFWRVQSMTRYCIYYSTSPSWNLRCHVKLKEEKKQRKKIVQSLFLANERQCPKVTHTRAIFLQWYKSRQKSNNHTKCPLGSNEQSQIERWSHFRIKNLTTEEQQYVHSFMHQIAKKCKNVSLVQLSLNLKIISCFFIINIS